MVELWLALQPHFSLWLAWAWGAYLVWLAGWNVLQKR